MKRKWVDRRTRVVLERCDRVTEDVWWSVLRDHAARAAELTYEAREGCPAFTYRFIRAVK